VEKALGKEEESEAIIRALDDWVGRISRKSPNKEISEIVEAVEEAICKLEWLSREEARSICSPEKGIVNPRFKPNEVHAGKREELLESWERQHAPLAPPLNLLDDTEAATTNRRARQF
jgi:hypothetical protein